MAAGADFASQPIHTQMRVIMMKCIQYFWHIRWLWSLGVLVGFGLTVLGGQEAHDPADPWQHYVVDVADMGTTLSLGIMMDELNPELLVRRLTPAAGDEWELGKPWPAGSSFLGSSASSTSSTLGQTSSPDMSLAQPWSHPIQDPVVMGREWGRYRLLLQHPPQYSPDWLAAEFHSGVLAPLTPTIASEPVRALQPSYPELRQESLIGAPMPAEEIAQPLNLVWEPSSFKPPGSEQPATGELFIGPGGPALKLTVSARPSIRRMELTTMEPPLGFYPQLLQASLAAADGAAPAGL